MPGTDNLTRAGSVLITGATGFIGSRLLATLSRNSDCRIVALIRPMRQGPRSVLNSLPGLTLVEDDGSATIVGRLLAEHSVKTVYHCATHYVKEHKPEDIPHLVEANVLLGCRIAEAVAQSAATRMITVGTRWQYYSKTSRGHVAANLYAAIKQAFQVILEYYADSTDRTYIVLDIGDTYGPNDTRRKLIPSLLDAMRSGHTIELSAGEQKLDLLHVDDVVAGLISAASPDFLVPDGQLSCFSLSSDALISVRELVCRFEHVMGKRLAVRWGAKSYRPREVMIPHSPHPPMPGWSPRVSLEDGLRSLHI